MSNKQPWKTPQLKVYGSVEKLTEQNTLTVNKNSGSGDTITLVINGTPTTVVISPGGGSITGTSP